MTNPELRQLALDIVDGRVVGTWSMQQTPERVTTVFPIVAMLDEAGMERMLSYAHIYQYVSEATPWAVNGQPSFLSFRALSHADWEALKPLLQTLVDQREAFMTTEPR